MESQTLNVGTGPLLSFGLTHPRPHGFLTSSTLQMNTFLQFCTFVNMSSQNARRTFRPSNFRFGSNVEQKVIGCAISNSKNHQHGTTMLDPNLGGSLACVNTSFSSCVRASNTPFDMQHQNVTDGTIGRTIVESSSGMTSVTFTLCTFSDMTIAAGDSKGGSAIFVDQAQSSLNITQCFFHKCAVTLPNDDGGATYFCENRTDCPVMIRKSSFTQCWNKGDGASFGGSVFSSSNSSITVSDCLFERSKSLDADGALSISYCDATTVTNCAFLMCSSFRCGGAMGIYRMNSIDLSFLQFRDCYAEDSIKANDLYCFFYSDSIITSDTVKFCDSTSEIPTALNEYSLEDLSDLLPLLDLTPTATVDVSFSGETATVTVTASGEVNGTMSVLLDGSNVPRLVHVSFGTSSSTSTIGTAVVSSGANGILPKADYTLRSFSIPGFWFPPEIAPTVTEASLEFTNEMNQYLMLKVKGSCFPKDSNSDFIVKIANTSKTFLLKFMTTRTGQSDKFEATPSWELEWEKEYTILSIVEDVASNPVNVICSNVVFTVTTPPHLTSAKIECETSECKSVRLVFEGKMLNPFGMFIAKIPEIPLNLTTMFSSSTKGESEPIEVFPTNPFPVDGFTIESMEEEYGFPSAQWVLVDKLPRLFFGVAIIGVNCTLDKTATTYTIQFFSVLVTSSVLEMELKDEMNNTVRVQAFLKDDVLTATEVVYPTSRSKMVPGQTYTVVSSNNESIGIPPSLNFTAPMLPQVLSASTEYGNVMCTTMTIVLRGQEFVTNLTFLLSVAGLAEPIAFSCSTRTSATIGPLEIGGRSDLTHSTTYSLSLIVEDNFSDPHRIHCDGVTFTTPSSPRLSTVHVSSVDGSDRLDCGGESDACETMEHALSRLDSGKSILLVEGTLSHVSKWEISFSSLAIAHKGVSSEDEHSTTHSTIRVGTEGGLVVDGASETILESLSFVLPSSSSVDVYAEIKTGLLTIKNCKVTGDVSTSSSLSTRHSSFVRSRNAMNVSSLTSTQLSHRSLATLLGQQSVGSTQISKLVADSIHTLSSAGSAVSFTLSNTSSLNLTSSSFTSCSSSHANCLGGGVSFSVSGSASVVIELCSFVSCSAGDGGRGGAIGLSFSADSSHNYLLDTLTFEHNTALFGRDLFLDASSLEKCVTIDRFLFNLHPPDFDRSNALFGWDRVAYVEETDLFPFLFPNTRFKNVFIDSLGASGDASDGADCGRESHPCKSLRDSMYHLLNADSEEEVTRCVLERSLVLIGDLVVGGGGDVELCGFVTVGQQAGLDLSLLPIGTYKGTETDAVEFGRVRFDGSGSIGCRLSFGLSEVVPPQTVLMKHLEFVLPLVSTHPQPIIAVQSVSVSLIDCVVKSTNAAQPVSSLLSFHSTLTSMPSSVHLRVSHLVAQNLVLSQPLMSFRSTSDLPTLMNSLSTGHSSTLSQALPFSLPPFISIEDSSFDSISLHIVATHDNVIETGSVLFADLSLPLSKLSMRDCSFSSCCTKIVSVPVDSDVLSSLAGGVCCLSLARSHLTLIDSCFVNCSFLLDPACSVPPSPSFLSLTSHALAVRFVPSQNISQLSSPLSAANMDSPLMAKILSSGQANPLFLFDETQRQSPLSSHLEIVGVEMEAGSSLDPQFRLPLALLVNEHSTPSLRTHSCVFHFETADPLNVGLAVVGVSGGAWPTPRNQLFVNCTSSRRDEN